jgi:type II secretory pathway pseudopilin PulG
MKQRNRPRQLAFSLAELLVVIGIIAVLVSVLIPVVSGVRRKAREADTRSLISQLQSAIEKYHQDHRAYPGPIPNNLIWNANANAGSFGATFTVPTPPPPGFDMTVGNLYTQITGAENLLLGLNGGLRATAAAGGGIDLIYDPTLVGRGPQSLNPLSPKRMEPYIAGAQLSWRETTNGKTGNIRMPRGPPTTHSFLKSSTAIPTRRCRSFTFAASWACRRSPPQSPRLTTA